VHGRKVTMAFRNRHLTDLPIRHGRLEQPVVRRIRAIDLFCGAGGSSWGASRSGVEIAAGFDLWSVAGASFSRNFPHATFYHRRLEQLLPTRIARDHGRIDLLLASPECTNHSPAKGAAPRCEKSRETAFEVVRFARALEPRWIVVENVVGMRSWRRYEEFTDRLRRIGYHLTETVLNSADFGVPQSRRRLFLLCDREGVPSLPQPSRHRALAASSILDLNTAYTASRLRSPTRADATLARAERAIESVGRKAPFLLVYYGSDHAGGWQSVKRPLRTVTTLDRFAYVYPLRSEHFMRMLQVPELKAAMGMPKRFQVCGTSRRDNIRLLGNAVCPPVMQQVVAGLTAN
jgi:DNA (cytosine-5)-methyltransferase 1